MGRFTVTGLIYCFGALWAFFTNHEAYFIMNVIIAIIHFNTQNIVDEIKDAKNR